MRSGEKAAGAALRGADERTGAATALRAVLRYVFPDHWSFWLGHIALFGFVVIILSGVFLTLWFEPSMTSVTYDGAYAPLRGVVVSEAYASTLELSFEVRGGLLMRQVHYWATHIFIAAMSVHLLRVFLTGAFRGPRKLNWLIGLGLLVLGILGGYTGHGLPDDLLSGTGLRVVPLYTEPLLVVLPADHRLAGKEEVTEADLAASRRMNGAGKNRSSVHTTNLVGTGGKESSGHGLW